MTKSITSPIEGRSEKRTLAILASKQMAAGCIPASANCLKISQTLTLRVAQLKKRPRLDAE